MPHDNRDDSLDIPRLAVEVDDFGRAANSLYHAPGSIDSCTRRGSYHEFAREG